MEFKDLSLKEIIELIKSQKTTQEEVYRYFLNRIDVLDPEIQAFNFVNNGFNVRSLDSKLA